MSETKCEHRYMRPVINTDTKESYAKCADCGEKLEGIEVIPVADMSKEMHQALDAIDGIDIPSFTPEDVAAISSLPLALIKSIVTEAQFHAITKFVNINQMVMGMTQGKSVPHA